MFLLLQPELSLLSKHFCPTAASAWTYSFYGSLKQSVLSWTSLCLFYSSLYCAGRCMAYNAYNCWRVTAVKRIRPKVALGCWRKDTSRSSYGFCRTNTSKGSSDSCRTNTPKGSTGCCRTDIAEGSKGCCRTDRFRDNTGSTSCCGRDTFRCSRGSCRTDTLRQHRLLFDRYYQRQHRLVFFTKFFSLCFFSLLFLFFSLVLVHFSSVSNFNVSFRCELSEKSWRCSTTIADMNNCKYVCSRNPLIIKKVHQNFHLENV